MKNKILLSICIPTYKRAKYLDICLQSILHYKNDNIEILVQDNNSPDNTSEIVSKYKDNRIKYEKNKSNIGPIKNIWLLINKAKGDYVFCLTDDDYFLPGAIQKLIDFITTTHPVCFKSDLIILLEKSKTSSYYKVKNNSKEELFLFSHIFTGLCFKKEELFKKLDTKFQYNNYPSMVIMGLLIGDATYLDQPIAMHIWENEVHWGEGLEPENENIKNEMISLILMLKTYIDTKVFKNILINHAIRNNGLNDKFREQLSNKDVLKIKKSILKNNIKNGLIKFSKKYFNKSYPNSV